MRHLGVFLSLVGLLVLPASGMAAQDSALRQWLLKRLAIQKSDLEQRYGQYLGTQKKSARNVEFYLGELEFIRALGELKDRESEIEVYAAQMENMISSFVKDLSPDEVRDGRNRLADELAQNLRLWSNPTARSEALRLRIQMQVDVAIFLSGGRLSQRLSQSESLFGRDVARSYFDAENRAIGAGLLVTYFFGVASSGLWLSLHLPGESLQAIGLVSSLIASFGGVLFLQSEERINQIVDQLASWFMGNPEFKAFVRRVAEQVPGAPRGEPEQIRWILAAREGQTQSCVAALTR